jgi:hypothetical protein
MLPGDVGGRRVLAPWQGAAGPERPLARVYQIEVTSLCDNHCLVGLAVAC